MFGIQNKYKCLEIHKLSLDNSYVFCIENSHVFCTENSHLFCIENSHVFCIAQALYSFIQISLGQNNATIKTLAGPCQYNFFMSIELFGFLFGKGKIYRGTYGSSFSVTDFAYTQGKIII